MRAARRRQIGADHLAAQRDDDEDGDGALRAEPFPGVEEVAEVADRSLVLLQHELDQFLEHAGDQHGDRAGKDRASHHGGADAQRRAEQPGDRAAADQDADAGGEAEFERQHVEQRRRQRDEDRLQRHQRHQHAVSAAIGTPAAAPASSPGSGRPRHRAGAAGDQQQHRLTEAQRIDDDPALMQHQQHADHREMHRAGAEREADQRSARRHHARFFAMRSPSRPCGRKISTMISSVKAIRSRNW